MQMFMIACHIDNKKNVIAFRIIDTDTGEVADYNYDAVKAVLMRNIHIDGLKLDNGVVKGSNGALTRYTKLCNGITVGKCPVVIVKEFPDKVYGVCNHLGKIVNMRADDLIQFIKEEGLANGKIVNGKISSICGEYPKDKMFTELAYIEKTKAKMNMLNIHDIQFNKENQALGGDNKAKELTIGRGCASIADKGFEGYKLLESITLPSTCTVLGKYAFKDCIALKEINIPEGVKEIPLGCFQNCKSLTKIVLPNSLTSIKGNAFKGCVKLVEISLGPIRPKYESTSIPMNTRLTVRR